MRAVLLLPFAAATTAVLTGATGRTGVLTYKALKEAGVSVRALVRNATKAKELLGCGKCDESEGIFIGDITKPETLTPVMAGADALVITAGPGVACKGPGFSGCDYLPGADPKTIQFDGVKNQVSAFAAGGAAGKHVVLMSTMLTTVPDNPLDLLGGKHGHATFFALNGEVFVMASGLEFTVVKPCGLTEAPAGQHKLLVGHDDDLFATHPAEHQVARADVARVLAGAVTSPLARGLRFDFCSEQAAAAEPDFSVFRAAELPWQQPRALLSLRGSSSGAVVLTGATGRTGVLTYAALKRALPVGADLRVLVRNATKARAVLKCSKCDESEGIFVGDITQPETMARAMAGASTLVVTTGPVVKCRFAVFGCKYLPGADPKAILYEGLKNQVSAFASAGGPAGKHVVLMSTALTTKPDNFLDKIGNMSHTTFYGLVGEAALLSSGLDATIVKPCGLADKEAYHSKLEVGHDDSLSTVSMIARADVARVLTAAATYDASVAKGLRFDLCSALFGEPQADLKDLLRSAAYPWNRPQLIV